MRFPFTLFVPTTFEAARTVQEQIRYLNDQIEQLKVRVTELEEEV